MAADEQAERARLAAVDAANRVLARLAELPDTCEIPASPLRLRAVGFTYTPPADSLDQLELDIWIRSVNPLGR